MQRKSIIMKMYILEGKVPKEINDVEEWAKWFTSDNRTVKKTEGTISMTGAQLGNITISTVFLGMDHGFNGEEPVLFETLVFGGPCDGDMDRCSTWEGAEKMHEKMIEHVRYIISKLKI